MPISDEEIAETPFFRPAPDSKETRYLLASPKNRKRLLEAVRDLENGGGVERTLIE